jgi:hypothetical protein
VQWKFTITGGVRIGWFNASWPLAQLSANKNYLVVGFFGGHACTFSPHEVFAIERYRGIFSAGIRIRHSVASYPEKIIFWCWGNPEKILNGISDSGFRTASEASDVEVSPWLSAGQNLRRKC